MLTVVHVEAGRHLYGGAQQVAWLLEALADGPVQNILVCPEGAAIAEACAAHARVIPMAMGGDTDLRFVARLAKVLRDTDADLVHLHSRRGADVLGGLAGRLCGLPTVLSRRVDNPEPRWAVPLKYRLFDRVITISEGIGVVLGSCGVPPHKLRCVRSAVDVARYQETADPDWFAAEFGLAPGRRALGVLAQFIPRKGHRYLLEALPPVFERFADVDVLLFGRGPLENALAAALTAPALAGRVHMAGFRTDLERVLPNLYGVVHPAEREGLGVSLMQAAAAGVPVLASAVGGIPEVVHDGITGRLVPPADVPALSDALAALLADPARARAWGEAGRAFVRSECTIAAMAAGNLAVYRELLGESGLDVGPGQVG